MIVMEQCLILWVLMLKQSSIDLVISKICRLKCSKMTIQ